jgi:hypothetical protein
MEDLTAQAMKNGVEDSAIFILFMTKHTFTRPYVQMELGEAFRLNKPILLVSLLRIKAKRLPKHMHSLRTHHLNFAFRCPLIFAQR